MRWIKDRGFPVRNKEGEIYRIAGVAEDVTERKHKEAEIQQLNETLEQRVLERTLQLQEVNAEMEAFAYSISHDLRAPLRTMQGFAQALEEDYGDQLDEMAQEYIQYITEGAVQMDTLIADLLSYSRLTRVQIELQEVDLNSVVQEALKLLGAQIKEKHALVTIDTLPSVRAHRPTLIQVITNLISNAIKFVEPHIQPKVHIYAREQKKLVYLWVEDNGIGIVNPLQVVNDGDAAVLYLSGQAPYNNRDLHPLPVLVLLDLKLPRRSGSEVLTWLRQQPGLKRLPVVVLTASKEYIDINKIYDLGVNAYIVKPIAFNDLVEIVKTLNMHWIIFNEKPQISVN